MVNYEKSPFVSGLGATLQEGHQGQGMTLTPTNMSGFECAENLRSRLVEIDRQLSSAILSYESDPLSANTSMLSALQSVRYLTEFANEFERLQQQHNERASRLRRRLINVLEEENRA